jgi:hypothetical protein
LRKNVTNYLQHTASDKGYLILETMRTGKLQTIALPPPIDTTASDAKDQKIIREEAVRAIAKRNAKLDRALEKGYATVTRGQQQLGTHAEATVAPRADLEDRADLRGI